MKRSKDRYYIWLGVMNYMSIHMRDLKGDDQYGCSYDTHGICLDRRLFVSDLVVELYDD